MSYNWDIIGDKVFGILVGSGFNLKMFDKTGAKTMDPHKATRFFATTKSKDPNLESFSILVGLHDDDASSHMDIKTPNLPNDDDFDKVYTLKKSLQTNIGDHEGLKVNWDQFDHEIKAKDDAVNNVKESQEEQITDIVESKDIGKVYGTTKSSYQRVGESRIIIRHTDSVDESKKGSRWRKIKNIFIENRIGERFNYPHPHLAGARAMARHITNEGSFNDAIGQSILKMSEDYIDLKRAGNMLRRSGDDRCVTVREAMHMVNKMCKRMVGPRGYKSSLDEMANKIIEHDQDKISALLSELRESCGCSDQDDKGMRSLETAARYISMAAESAGTIDGEFDEEMLLDDEIDLVRIEELAGIKPIE